MKQKEILIIGGGYGGIKAAQSLADKQIENTRVRLISDKPHFEYTSRLYRVVTGKTPLQVCIPLRDFFSDKQIDVIVDKITDFNFRKKIAIGDEDEYKFDHLILAVGAETTYFNLPGLEKLAFGFKSIRQALELKRHLHEVFTNARGEEVWEQVDDVNIAVVGAGASGVEIAGELALYTKKLAKKHGIKPSVVSIELIEAADRVLPAMPEDISEKVRQRLENLGVKLFLNRQVVKSDIEKIYLRDMQMKTKTVIWTAGVAGSHLLDKISNIKLDKKGRAEVNEYLEVKGKKNLYAIGDIVQDEYWGMAQTALHHGEFIAEHICRKITSQELKPYESQPVAYAVPAGSGWAAALYKGLRFFGRLGWWIRQLADLRFFLSTLPLKKALRAFEQEGVVSEQCEECLNVHK